jgi:hypothetical protein
MPTMEEYAKQTPEQRLERMARTADDLENAVKSQSDTALSRRPDPKNWSAKECICHLRDTEEFLFSRIEQLTAMNEPTLFAWTGLSPDRWAEERQYLRHDVSEAIGHFRRRRGETLTFLRTLTPNQWQRAGVHPTRGRVTVDGLVTLMAWHDDNHLDQLRRALAGRA